MKLVFAFTILFFICLSSLNIKAQTKIYKLIKKTNQLPGDININEIKKLNEPLKALAAFYSAMGGSYCSNDSCRLTTALGLGKQGSDAHKTLIKKYFPKDETAKAVLAQDCYLRPDGASSFNAYEYLNIITIKDTVKVNYRICIYSSGVSKFNKRTDIYLLENTIFKVLYRKQ